jgi:hypothetical protein
MLHNSNKINSSGLPSDRIYSSKIAANPTFSSMPISRVELYANSILREYESDRSGVARENLLLIAKEFLISGPVDQSFSLLHQYCLKGSPINFEAKTLHFKPISASDFEMFLSQQGQTLIDEYKDGKWRGRTGCGPISLKTVEILNEIAQGKCADIEGISHHAFSLVLVEGQPYLLDFTFDQFLDYERVRNWQSKTDDTVSYAGVLIMPVDRMALKFDKKGSLID